MGPVPDDEQNGRNGEIRGSLVCIMKIRTMIGNIDFGIEFIGSNKHLVAMY
jgi:hypothetical protein